MSDHYETLRKRIIEHCARMAKFDREYAVWAWKQYCEALPWLNLAKKQKVGRKIVCNTAMQETLKEIKNV